MKSTYFQEVKYNKFGEYVVDKYTPNINNLLCKKSSNYLSTLFTTYKHHH